MTTTTPRKKTLRRLGGFTYTTAIKKLRALRKAGARTYVIPGGTSAGKTFGILPLLIDFAAKEAGLSISVVSESIPHLKKGAIKDFKSIMLSTRRWVDDRYNKTDRVYTFGNGSYIEFFSADSEGRVRGPRRNILYVNECNNISFETYYQLAIRTDREVWLDYNPSNEFWVNTELDEDEDAVKLILTYLDNEALAPSIVKEIELVEGLRDGLNRVPYGRDLPKLEASRRHTAGRYAARLRARLRIYRGSGGNRGGLLLRRKNYSR